jgi:hypothetical protein
MVREDDLRETLDRAAYEIAEIQSNPRAWLSWMVTAGEAEAREGWLADKDSFMEMLGAAGYHPQPGPHGGW